MGKNDPTNLKLWKQSLVLKYGKGAFLSKEFLKRDWERFQGKGVKKNEKEIPASAAPMSKDLKEIMLEIGDCKRCKLCSTRTHIVFGEGSPKAKIMFVGEGPGEQEDLTGRPFVGRAGQLLTKIIEAMGFAREDVYIANVVKCRPPDNRKPQPDEVAACEGFLLQQIDAVNPKVIVALGATALECLVKTDVKITKSRGKFMDFMGRKLLPTYHPAYLLRNPPAKKDVWEDMKLVAKELGHKIPVAKT